MFSVISLTVVAALLSCGHAAPSSSSPSSTASAPAATHTVSVGAGGLVFTPDQTTANVGDIIEFRFYPQNHSVARSAWQSPCIPYEDTGVNLQGFWSGFHPMAVILDNPPIFQVRVNDTEPIFFYCSAPGACIDDGMVGVINANDTETLDIQKEFAKNSTLMFSPGEYFPSEIVPTSSPTATPTPTASTTTTITPSPIGQTTAPVANKSSSGSSSLSAAAIAGISIAAAAVVIIAAALIYMCGRQKTMGEILRNTQSQPPSSVGPLVRPDHLSMTSASTYTPKAPYFDINDMNANHSSRGAEYRSAEETESYRSRSPPLGEPRADSMVLPIQTNSALVQDWRQRSMQRRPVPESPTSRSQISAISPVHEQVYHPFHTDVPTPLRLIRRESDIAHKGEEDGPHELSGGTPTPYQAVHPALRDKVPYGMV